jgi:adenylate kinase family enzyme
MKTFCLIGTTNSGKSTVAEKLVTPDIGLIQVGKQLRKKYPPEFFKGSGSPDHIEEEALSMLVDLLSEHQDKKVILIDGQPRRVEQVDPLLQLFPDLEVIWLYETNDVLFARGMERAKSGEDLNLNLKRIDNDVLDLYHVLYELKLKNIPIHITTERIYDFI